MLLPRIPAPSYYNFYNKLHTLVFQDIHYQSFKLLVSIFFCHGLLIRRCPLKTSAVSGKEVCPVRTFWRKKLWIFRNFWCVRTNKGEGVNFSRFCADVF